LRLPSATLCLVLGARSNSLAALVSPRLTPGRRACGRTLRQRVEAGQVGHKWNADSVHKLVGNSEGRKRTLPNPEGCIYSLSTRAPAAEERIPQAPGGKHHSLHDRVRADAGMRRSLLTPGSREGLDAGTQESEVSLWWIFFQCPNRPL